MKHRLTAILLCLLLASVTTAVYRQSLDFGFVGYDDNLYVSQNPQLQKSFDADTLRWAFSPFHSNWIPLTWLSLALDRELGGSGTAARAYHRSNLILHVLNSMLLLWALLRLSGSLWPSAFTAAVFALHPLHVESVAWIAERKDVLSGLFWMLALLAYARYVERPSWGFRYWSVALCLALGLMAKPMLVSLPLVLLLLDFWPLRRLTNTAGQFQLSAVRRALLEKLPLLALSVAASIVTFTVQDEGGSVQRFSQTSLGSRVANAILAYGSYLKASFWPVDLAVFYPHLGEDVATSAALGWGCALAALSLAVLLRLHRQPALAVGWFWFLGTLVPVIGLVQVGLQSRADRYMYLPQIGLVMAVAWTLPAWLQVESSRVRRAAVAVMALLALGNLTRVTWAQLPHWKDGVSLFTHASRVVGGNAVAYFNLGHQYLLRDETDLAFHQFHEAWRSDPDWTDPKIAMGDIQAGRGELGAARRWFERVLKGAPDNVHALSRVGRVEIDSGSPRKSLPILRRALRLEPRNPEVRALLAEALAAAGQFDAAVTQYRKSVELDPRIALVHGHLGRALADLGDARAAVESYESALEIDASLAEVRANLAVALARLGRDPEAIVAIERSVADGFEDAKLRHLEAQLHFRGARPDRGMAALRAALAFDPDNVAAHNDLAWYLATESSPALRDPAKAVAHAEIAARATERRVPSILETLAVALEAAGRLDDAVAVIDEALVLAPPEPSPEWVGKIRARRARLIDATPP